MSAPSAGWRGLWRRRVLEVTLAQLRQGITPQKIALTIALGFILGLFPILGTTTALCLAFGLFHLQQGFDVAIAVGLLGVVWGVLYIRRRSVVTSMVSHAGFDVVQVLQQVLLRSLPS